MALSSRAEARLSSSFRKKPQAERLQRAREHIFITALPDGAVSLSLANLQFGMAKIHWVQEQLGLAPDATFISAPDFTVTRNSTRWSSGFGYGGSLQWGDGDQPLTILDLKPNACGMLVGGLSHPPQAEHLLQAVERLRTEDLTIDGVKIEWDFGNGNHFIDVFEVEPQNGAAFLPFMFILHFSGKELRRENDSGPGLYWDQSPTLQRKMRLFETPFGPLRVLLDEAAREYLEYYRRVEAFIFRRRMHAAQAVFGDFELIHNGTHQGLTGLNEILLGCYRFSGPDELYPIGLRPNLPAYLVRGRPNLSSAAIESLGFAEPAKRLGVLHRLQGANLLPHGGGYAYPQIEAVTGVHPAGDRRYFELQLADSESRQLVAHLKDLPFEYRGESVVTRTLQLEMGVVAARLIPKLVLKV